ncbi:hypothetical protein [Halorientalis halophila]|uniref:hypothetical protein n=1 Tax=Halorientalis halophila TaxID=3108499 RepID=UPI0030096674
MSASHLVERDDSFRLLFQYSVATTALLLAARLGVFPGSLAPLIRFGMFEILVVPIQWAMYFVGVLVVVASTSGPGAFAAPLNGGPDPDEVDSVGYGSALDRVTLPSLGATAIGAVIGGWLVVAVPDWLSALLPRVALSAAAVAFVLAGVAVPVRGVDTALSTAGGTVFLLLVPMLTYPVLGFFGLALAAVVALPALVVVRGWSRGGAPVGGRLALSMAVGLSLVAGGAMAYDLSGPRPTESLDTDETVNLSTAENRTYARTDEAEDRPMVRVGSLRVHNEFRFTRTATLPSYDACLYGENGTRPVERRAFAPVAETDGWVHPVDDVRLAGGEHRQFGVVVLLDNVEGRSLAEVRELGTVPVRLADSRPETTDGPALVLVPDDEN